MILIIKLISGEELIADVTDSETSKAAFNIKQPCLLQMIPSRANPEQPMMALVPYATYTESHNIEVEKNTIIWQAKPVVELYNQYNSIFGSGIMLATAGA